MDKNKKFLELRKKWYKRIADDGFVDAETPDGHLKQYSGSTTLREDMPPITKVNNYSTKLWKESQAEYYRQAAQFLWSQGFESERDKQAWFLHSQGDTLSTIGIALGISRGNAQGIIERLRSKFYGPIKRRAKR